MSSADFVIVGGGSSGATLAARLSEDPSCSVILLEAGGAARSHWIDWPIGIFKTVGHDSYDWRFHTDPSPHLAGRQISWPRGRGLGGSSLINGMLYLRGHQRDYDQWEALGNSGWAWRDVLSSFERSAGGLSASEGGGTGPFHVSQLPRDEISDAFIASAQQFGIPYTGDFNQGDNTGVGYFKMNTLKGKRVSSASAYLHPAMNRKNLTILPNSQAVRIVLENGRAVGVEFYADGGVLRADARCEVILSAGAIQSPHLLQLSGIGPSHDLIAAGIRVAHDLVGVGANLQDHLQVRPMFKCKGVRTLNDVASSKLEQVKAFLQYQLTHTGAIAESVFRAGAFFSSSHAEPGWPDAQIHLGLMSFDRPDQGPHPFPGITLSACLLRPKSRGSILARSADPFLPPSINAGYLEHEDDAALALELLKNMRTIAATQPLAKFIDAPHEQPAAHASNEELMTWIRNKALSIYHPVGTCAMGPQTARHSVVDARLRVHGIERLRVVDASIMPIIVSGNTNAPSVMIGEHASAMIKNDWSR